MAKSMKKKIKALSDDEELFKIFFLKIFNEWNEKQYTRIG